MENYKKRFANILAETGAIFFDENLILKDGRPTPYFVNLGMFRTGRLSMEIGSFFADMMIARGLVEGTDIILGPSYKGSAIALATAIALHVNHGHELIFDYDRKEAKTHGEGSGSASFFVNKSFFDGCRVFIVDDVATSMRTKYDLLKMVQEEAGLRKIEVQVAGIGIAVDREKTTAVYDDNGRVILNKKGENAIRKFSDDTRIPVHIVAGIREIIEHLYYEKIPVMIKGKRQQMDDDTKALFDEYIWIYGHR